MVLLTNVVSLQWREGKEYKIPFFPCPIWFRSCSQTPCPKVNSNNFWDAWNYAAHIAISANMNAMHLIGSKTVNAFCCQKQQCQQQKPQQQKSHTTSTTQHACSNCTKSYAPGRSSCSTTWWSQHGWSDTPTWPWMARNRPEYITITDIDTNTMTEAFITVKMSADIGPNWLRTICCKVDYSTGGNIMPLCIPEATSQLIRCWRKAHWLASHSHPTDSLQWKHHTPAWCTWHHHQVETQLPLPTKACPHLMVHSRQIRTCYTRPPIIFEAWSRAVEMCCTTHT